MNFRKILLTLVFFTTLSYGQEILVTKIEGNAFVSNAGQWQKAVEGMAIGDGSSLTTGDSSYVILNFSDGHTVEVRANSIFSIKTYSDTSADLDLWLGEIYARVKKLKPSQKFSVRTPAAVCAVRGTKFKVAVDKDKKTGVSVDEGIVGVMDSSGAGKEVFVKKGMMSSVEPGQAAAEPVKTPPPSKKEKKTALQAKEKRKAQAAKAPAAEETPQVGESAVESFPAPAQKERKPAKRSAAASSVNMNGSVGAVALTRNGVTKVYYEFSMYPELTFGKLGIGLELVVHFDENNQILKDEWYLDQYPSKIDHIRWGHKHRDPFYFLIGRFRNPVTIGHGMIVNNYSNMAQYPNVKKMGLEFDLDRGKWGLEGVTGDLARPKFFASRLYFRPLRMMGLGGIPLLKNLKVAGTVGTDTNPDSLSSTKNDDVSVVGADAELPVLSFKYLNATAYADWAKMQFGSAYDSIMVSTGGFQGTSYGLSGKILFLNFRGEYRRLDNNFIPGYFDGYYDIDRWKYYEDDINGNVVKSTMTKAAYYLDSKGKDPIKAGPYIQGWFNFFNILNFNASYENYNTVGSNDPYYPHLIASAELLQLPGLSQYTLSAHYDKRSARNWKAIKEINQNAILTVDIGYNVAPNVMMLIEIRRSFDAAGNETKSMNAQTKMKF